jgi:hypothetical protein
MGCEVDRRTAKKKQRKIVDPVDCIIKNSKLWLTISLQDAVRSRRAILKGA